MKRFLPEAVVTKFLLDSAHDAMPYYEYCRDQGIVPFIDLNVGRGRPPVYKDDFTINNDVSQQIKFIYYRRFAAN